MTRRTGRSRTLLAIWLPYNFPARGRNCRRSFPWLRIGSFVPVGRSVYGLPQLFRKTTQSWPTAERPATARLTASLIRLPDGELERRDPRFKDFVLFDHSFSKGASGCPIFLANGHVVAMCCTSAAEIGSSHEDTTGLRIDCLRELLTYHNLNGPSSTNGKPLVGRPDWGPDPRLDQFRRAVSLVRDADRLRRAGKNRAAIEICNEVLRRRKPEYGGERL